MTQLPRKNAKENWILEAVECYQSQLIAYASNLLGNRESAREIVQDAYLKLCEQKRESVEPKLPAWLYQVVRNRSLNLIRKDKRMIHGLGNEQLESLAGSGQPQPSSGVFEMIQSLPAKQSELLMLKFAQGLSYKEISEVTGLTTGNVGYILHHAVQSLKALWEASEADGQS